MDVTHSISKTSQTPDYLLEYYLVHQLESTLTTKYSRLLTKETMSISTIGHAENLLSIDYLSTPGGTVNQIEYLLNIDYFSTPNIYTRLAIYSGRYNRVCPRTSGFVNSK